MDDEGSFSSWAYLIGLGRSLDLVYYCVPRESDEDIKAMCMNADTSIAAWLACLAKAKRRLVDEDGSLDEALYRGYMLVAMYIAKPIPDRTPNLSNADTLSKYTDTSRNWFITL